jgi:hypothetical protein
MNMFTNNKSILASLESRKENLKTIQWEKLLKIIEDSFDQNPNISNEVLINDAYILEYAVDFVKYLKEAEFDINVDFANIGNNLKIREINIKLKI